MVIINQLYIVLQNLSIFASSILSNILYMYVYPFLCLLLVYV